MQRLSDFRSLLSDYYQIVWGLFILGFVLFIYWDTLLSKLPKPQKDKKVVGRKGDRSYSKLDEASKFKLAIFLYFLILRLFFLRTKTTRKIREGG